MFTFEPLYRALTQNGFEQTLITQLATVLNAWRSSAQYRNALTWQPIVQQLPTLTPYYCDLLQGVTAAADLALPAYAPQLTVLLRQLIPWRKGPFDLYGVYIDSEWRADWKWQRLLPHISPLIDRQVLDVGCSNGYYLWRMIGAGARLALGIDPNPRFLCQFEAVRKLLDHDQRVQMAPLGIEQLPPIQAFDAVFSMGVLYHRRSPLDHLQQLKQQLRSGGELILETLVIDGDAQQVLLPSGRYAQMRNVYFIPSSLALQQWLAKCGFINIRLVNQNSTSTAEQRCTAWSGTQSLSNYLDPADPHKTIEGYPAPMRAIVIANAP